MLNICLKNLERILIRGPSSKLLIIIHFLGFTLLHSNLQPLNKKIETNKKKRDDQREKKPKKVWALYSPNAMENSWVFNKERSGLWSLEVVVRVVVGQL